MTLGFLDPVAFHLFSKPVYWYGIIIATTVFFAYLLADREATRRGLKQDTMLDLLLIALPIAFIFARAYYVIFRWEYYAGDFSSMIAIWDGGIAIYGGLIGGFIVLYFFARRRGVKIIKLLDIIAPSLLVGQMLGRWGNFFNQEAYGAVVENLDYLPGFIKNQMYIDGSYRQPTFLYESIWNLIGFALIVIFRRRLKGIRSGHITAFYLIWYGFGRMIIEGMRTDSLMFLGIRVSQLLSVFLIGLGIYIIIYQNRKKAPFYNVKKEN